MTLTGKQKRYLRGLAHSLKPVVQIGDKGLTPSVIASIQAELENHELIKIRANSDNGMRPKKEAPNIASTVDASLVGAIGRIITLYKRRSQDATISLP